MKKLVIAAALAAVTFSSCGTGGAGSLKNESDSLAYAMGVFFGMNVKDTDSTANVATIAGAIKAVLNGDSKMTVDQADQFIREYFMVRIPARNKKAAEEFILSVEQNNKNVVKTESGLLYEIITPGDDNVKAVNDTDKVSVLYTGTTKDGKMFDTNIRTAADGTVKADTTTFALNQVIPGWTEGMKYVGKGGKIKLYIPHDLAYGVNVPYGSPIQPNEALVFEVELVDVIPTPAEAETK